MGPEWVTESERVLITDSSGTRVVGKVVKTDEWDYPSDHVESEAGTEEIVEKAEELTI